MSLPISPINNGHYIFCSFFWVNHPLMDPFELGMNSSNVQLSSSSWGGASRTAARRPHAKILPTHSIWISISNRYYKVRIIIHKRQKTLSIDQPILKIHFQNSNAKSNRKCPMIFVDQYFPTYPINRNKLEIIQT